MDDFGFLDIVKDAASKRASDIFIKAGSPPRMKLHGDILDVEGYPILTDESAEKIIYENLTQEQIGRFERTHELDASLRFLNICRFRLCVYKQRGSIAAVFRSGEISFPAMGRTSTILPKSATVPISSPTVIR